jgi:hypothetical protein
MPAGSGVAPLADVPDGARRDGFSQLVVRCKHPVIAMPVLPRRRDEIDEPVEELKRREFDDAIGSRPRGLPPAGFRIAAGLLGFAMGESRQPATDAQRADRQRLAERIQAAIKRCGVAG